MLKNIKNFKARNQSGFTIIEVMIVLAVAALIILIVLLAVPALQRSSRNTTIKNDASSVASGVTNWETNNNGLMPNSVTSSNGVVTIGNGTSGLDATVKVQGTTTVSSQDATSTLPSISGASPALGPGAVVVWFGHKCAATAGDTTSTDYPISTRSTAVLYVSENGSNNELQCIEA